MKTALMAAVVAVVCLQTAQAFWTVNAVTREEADRRKLPLAVTVAPFGDDSVWVTYEVTLAGPFEHLTKAEVLFTQGTGAYLRVPVAAPPVILDGDRGGHRPERVTGSFRVSKSLLGNCTLSLECPLAPISTGGETVIVNLASYLKK